MKVDEAQRKSLDWLSSDTLTLVPTDAEAVLVEVALVGLSPLLLGLTATAVSPSAAGHLLVRLGHTRSAKASLVLRERLTTRAWACRRISLVAPIPKLPPMPLTLR